MDARGTTRRELGCCCLSDGPADGGPAIDSTAADNEVDDVPIDNANVGMGNNSDNLNTSASMNDGDSFQPDIFDPRYWDSLGSKQIDILAQKGPKRDLSIQKDVNDTTGQGLFDVLQDQLKDLDLDIDDVRGQGYDNGSNMEGCKNGVQKKLLDLNPRAFYSACSCHSLNLTLCDMAKTCGKAKDFFGIIQRIYTIFANSTKKWQILKDNITRLTPKSVSATRWESRVESVKAIRLQCADIREALLQVSDIDSDPKTSSEAKGLANNELGEYEFIVAIVIRYEVLYAVNLVSKQLQSKDMLIDVAIEKVQGLIVFFQNYRETGFLEALETAKGIALEMDIGTSFRKRRKIKRKRHFDENPDVPDIATLSPEESFRISYFIPIVDQAISSLTRRFEQYQGYQKMFGFLFTSETLQSLDNESLKSSCDNLEAALEKDGKSDIDANE
ncbi:General transcription factor 2-related zinc finger protein, partial [Zea mays]